MPIAEEKKFDLRDFPWLMKGRYGFTVLDLVNNHFASADPAYIEKLTTAIAKAGCRVWNVKIHLPAENIQLTIDSYQELAEYAGRRNVKVVVENHGHCSGRRAQGV